MSITLLTKQLISFSSSPNNFSSSSNKISIWLINGFLSYLILDEFCPDTFIC